VGTLSGNLLGSGQRKGSIMPIKVWAFAVTLLTRVRLAYTSKLLLVFHPAEGRRLSKPLCVNVTGD